MKFLAPLAAACAIAAVSGTAFAQNAATPAPQNVLQLAASGSVDVQQDLLVLTRSDAGSQTGRAPMNASACAMSSPPVRIFDVPHTLIASDRRCAPCSWKCRVSSTSADFRPSSHAVGVGTARLSIE